MKNKLPKNWVEVQFTNILDIVGGTQPPKSVFIYEPALGYIRLLQIRDFGDKPHPTYIPITNKISTCKKSDILIARYGASIGKILTGMEGAYNVAMAKVIIPDNVDNIYIKWLLKSNIFQLPITTIQRTAQNGFNKQDLSNLTIPLPPLAEQKRMADKLDVLFGRLETIRKATDRIPELIKTFRQQILTYAITGKLTEEWRQGKKLDEWKSELASQCCQKVQNGGTPQGGLFENSGVPFLKVYNIVQNKIDFESEPQYVSNEIQNSQIKKSIAYPGDVVMNIVGPPLNKIAIIPDTYPEWNLNQAITLFRTKDYLDNKYLYYFFCEGSPVNSLINQTRGVVGQVNISLSQCRNFMVSIPPIEEQKEIVNRVQSLFDKVDIIEQRYQTLKAKLDNLPQALLYKAFKGELVEQLPSDGNAADLLNEIEQLKKSLGKK